MLHVQNFIVFIPDGLIDNTLAFVQEMAWCRTGDKPLSELMMTRPQGSTIRVGNVTTLVGTLTLRLPRYMIDKVYINKKMYTYNNSSTPFSHI